MRNFANFWRVYSLDDEAGVIICSYPADKPAIPLTYNSETMTGFEWAYATHLLSMGMTKKSFEVATAIRKRFDGKNATHLMSLNVEATTHAAWHLMGCCLPHRISNTTVTMESSDFLR